jgi:hypothetical protein
MDSHVGRTYIDFQQGDLMKFNTTVLYCAALLSFLSGCSTVKVDCEQAPGFDFSGIRTYQWIEAPENDADKGDRHVNREFMKKLNNELSVRGLTQVLETPQADVQVAYYTKIEEHAEYTTVSPDEDRVTSGFIYTPKEQRWTIKETAPDLNIYTVETGLVTLLVFDTKSGKQIWKGSLQAKIDRSRPLEKQNERIYLLAHDLMKHFPIAYK